MSAHRIMATTLPTLPGHEQSGGSWLVACSCGWDHRGTFGQGRYAAYAARRMAEAFANSHSRVHQS